jgi:hypothetical protein
LFITSAVHYYLNNNERMIMHAHLSLDDAFVFLYEFNLLYIPILLNLDNYWYIYLLDFISALNM